MRFALLVSRYYREVIEGMEAGVREYLAEQGLSIAAEDVFEAPGAFELPLLAQELGRTSSYDGIICLGCVVKGDTAHFEYISQAAADGILRAGLSTHTPIAFGVLTVYTLEQALERARPGSGNKGREAAFAAFQAAQSLRAIRRNH
jgi:6,7-dimethyl-8-ribityllumazine synthase